VDESCRSGVKGMVVGTISEESRYAGLFRFGAFLLRVHSESKCRDAINEIAPTKAGLSIKLRRN
jgi:hypothetical protein